MSAAASSMAGTGSWQEGTYQPRRREISRAAETECYALLGLWNTMWFICSAGPCGCMLLSTDQQLYSGCRVPIPKYNQTYVGSCTIRSSHVSDTGDRAQRLSHVSQLQQSRHGSHGPGPLYGSWALHPCDGRQADLQSQATSMLGANEA